MSNKEQLQYNNSQISTYIDRILVAKETAASLPDAGSGGGTAVAVKAEICIRTKNNPRPTASFFVESIDYVTVDANGVLTTNRNASPVYMTYLDNVVVGTFLFIKTINSPTSCTINDAGLELVSFDASVGAVVKVVNSNAFEGMGIVFG